MANRKSQDPYSKPSTTATLMWNEAILILRLYAELGDWQKVRARVMEENTLRVRTQGSLARLYGEAKSRLIQLTVAQRDLLLTGSLTDQRQLLWLALCRRYPFIGEFAELVVREKYLRFDRVLTDEDYYAFYSDRSAWRPEILKWSDTTRKQQKALLFRSLREAEMMTEDNQLLKALLSDPVADAILSDSPKAFLYFTVADQEIAAWMRR